MHKKESAMHKKEPAIHQKESSLAQVFRQDDLMPLNSAGLCPEFEK